jgi:signal peptidase I
MNRLKFRLSDSTKVFISAFSASILFVSNVGCISMLEGPSMLPTFNVAGDLVMVDKLFYKYKPLELGQVYVYISPQNPNRLVVKRLIGKPGDVVYIDPMQGTEKLRVWDIN